MKEHKVSKFKEILIYLNNTNNKCFSIMRVNNNFLKNLLHNIRKINHSLHK